MRSIGEVLREVEMRLPSAVRQLIMVSRLWDDVVDAVGIPRGVSKPLFIWSGYLHVAVKTPSVAQAIRLRADDVLGKLRKMGIEVVDLRFHTGRSYFKRADTSQKSRSGCVFPPESLIKEAEKELSDVKDPEIRRKLAILIARGRCEDDRLQGQ